MTEADPSQSLGPDPWRRPEEFARAPMPARSWEARLFEAPDSETDRVAPFTPTEPFAPTLAPMAPVPMAPVPMAPVPIAPVPTTPVPTTPVPTTRGRGGRRVLLAVLAVATVTSLGLGAAAVAVRVLPVPATELLTGARPAGFAARLAPLVASSSAAPGTAAVVDRNAQIEAALATMNAALASGDQAAFLSVADPSAAPFLTRLRMIYQNLRTAPFTSPLFSWRERGAGSAPGHAGMAETVLAQVAFGYRLTEWDPNAVSTAVGFTFGRRGSRWLLVSDTDANADLPFGSYSEPWWAAAITLERRPHVLVIGQPSRAADNRRLADTMERSIATVRAAVPAQHWNGKAVVYAITTAEFVRTWFGTRAQTKTRQPGDQGAVAAEVSTLYGNAVWSYGDQPGRATVARMVITPFLLSKHDASSDAVLRHELTHVALALDGTTRPATWLSEGIAEFVAFRSVHGTAVDPATSLLHRGLARATWTQLRAGTWKPTLKTEPRDFYGGTAVQVDDAYTNAWLTCLYIADHYGEAKLYALYEAAAASSEPTRAAGEAAALRQVLKTSHKALLAATVKFSRNLRRKFV